ncbi:hypothetical protein BE221DRAFT_202261 [Ostreococcus tauri]|uniref:Leucine-rich repeat n=1 Tax=Ostreococcus tauri TaxID=70448 RepID=A0A1Y5I0R2_OSTTA|nr:hypothetical protein BE221DRAFT_202261 [Ostreococcus tauri]
MYLTRRARMSRLVHVNLSGNAFTGELPPSLAAPKFLRKLEVQDNGFYGEIPEWLIRRDHLELVDFTRNSFTGVLPSAFYSAFKFGRNPFFCPLPNWVRVLTAATYRKAPKSIEPTASKGGDVLTIVGSGFHRAQINVGCKFVNEVEHVFVRSMRSNDIVCCAAFTFATWGRATKNNGTVVGMFINYTFYGIDGCVLHFVDAPSHISTLVDRSKNKKLWVHFIGDSDTRGLVLGLLRFLYSPLRAAVTREMFAKAYDCWDEASQTCPGVDIFNLARLGHIDYQFCTSQDGVFKNQKHYARGWYSKDKTDLLENVFDYNLRVSFGFAGPDGQFVSALRYWTELDNESFPDIFYLNLGAWFSHGNITTTESVTSLIGNLQEKTGSDIIYGSSLSFRQHLFDDAVARIIHLKREVGITKLHLFDRSVFGGTLMKDLKLKQNSGHAPLIGSSEFILHTTLVQQKL